MPVISTTLARHRPMAAPMAMAPTSSAAPTGSICRASASAIVAIRATAMPAMPKVLPALDVSCLDSPASARMNSRAATTYAAVAVVSVFITWDIPLAPREHGQHAAGHGKAAENVDAGEQDRQGCNCGDDDIAVPDLQQRTDDDD